MAIIGGLVLLSVFGGASYYVAFRLFCALRTVKSTLRFRWFCIGGILSGLLLTLGFARSFLPLPDLAKDGLKWLNAYWMGIFIYVFIFILLTDLVLLVTFLVKRWTHRTPPQRFRPWVMAVAMVLAAITCGYGFWNGMHISHTTYTVSLSPALQQNPIHMVLISDLHLGAVGSEARLTKAVDEINRLSPDLICIAGDLFDNDFDAISNPAQVTRNLQSLKAPLGVYACLGNHDSGDTTRQMEQLLSDSGVQVLQDQYTIIDGRLVLAGRRDSSPIGGHHCGKRTELPPNPAPELPLIVMDHNPAHIDQYGVETDIILCGHTHEGQLFPANIITQAIYAVDYGYYRKDAQSPQVIVTSGLGTWGMPMRVGTKGEIVSIRLQ